MNMFRASVLPCLSLFLMSSAALAQDQKPTVPPGSVYVAPVETADKKLQDLAKQVNDAISQEIAGKKEFSVASAADNEDIAKCTTIQGQLGTDDSEECLAVIEKATDAKYIVSATVGKLGRDYAITVSLLDAKEAKVLGKTAGSAPTAEGALKEATVQVRQLFGYAKSSGPVFSGLPKRDGVTKIGVFGIESTGVANDDVRNLTQFLQVELSKLKGAEVISPEDIETIIGAPRFDDDCDDECMAKIAGSLNVNYLVTGQVGSFSAEPADEDEGEEGAQKLREFVISLKLIDPKAVKVVNRQTIAFLGPKEELKRAVRTVARQLVGVQTDLGGTVAVSGPVVGADIFINEKKVGELPLKLPTAYPPVRTPVRLVKDGYYAWQSDVFIQPGEENLIWADLTERPSPWYTKWWVWTIVGVAVVGGATAAVVVLNDEPETGTGVVTIQ